MELFRRFEPVAAYTMGGMLECKGDLCLLQSGNLPERFLSGFLFRKGFLAYFEGFTLEDSVVSAMQTELVRVCIALDLHYLCKF